MQCSRVNSRGRSRRVQQGTIHQGAVITILNVIVSFSGHVAFLRLVGHFDLDWIFGVVEINDMNIKDQHSGARNKLSYGGRKKNLTIQFYTHKQQCVRVSFEIS